MKRFFAVLAAFALLGTTAIAVAQTETPVTHRITDANGSTFDVALPFTVDVIPTTTTTTTMPTTTTTTLPPLVIPPTQEYQPGAESFQFSLNCASTATVPCPSGSNITSTLHYAAHGMPYLYEGAVPGNHDHAWWVAGDREGYRCAYSFMYDQHPNPLNSLPTPREGHFIARATVVRPLEAGYGRVNDKYMDEGQRYYDGTVHTGPGAEIIDEDCQKTALDPDFDYANYVPHGPDAIRVGLFKADGQIADVRDFTHPQVATAPTSHYEYVGTKDGRVTVVYVVDGLGVSHVVYYDALADGQIAVEVNGELTTD